MGFRNEVVRSVNQFNFSMFGTLTGSRGTSIVQGKKHWLFEQGYVDLYGKEFDMRDGLRVSFVNRLQRLQNALLARDIAFILVISPSKSEIYPEYLPSRIHNRVAQAPPARTYTILRQELEDAGVHVLDAHRTFEALKPDHAYLFPKTGTHWSYYGCFLACNAMLVSLNATDGLQIPVPRLDGVLMEPCKGSDNDLLRLLNLYGFEGQQESLMPYPKIAVEAAPVDARPNVLVVGDSFSFTLIDALRLGKAVGEVDLFYYFKRHFRYPASDTAEYMQDHVSVERGPLQRDAIDWQRTLLDKDIVILEVNEIMLSACGWGFVESALKAMDITP